jgi:hypothetical protein
MPYMRGYAYEWHGRCGASNVAAGNVVASNAQCMPNGHAPHGHMLELYATKNGKREFVWGSSRRRTRRCSPIS